MSAKTVTAHKPSELRHEGTANGVAVFSSASKSRAARNFTYVDVATLAVSCECIAPKGTCWHADWAATAYLMTTVATFVALLSDTALEEVGAAAAATGAAGTHTVTDIAVLWQARVEHCRRARARREVATPLAALPDPALVLAKRRGGRCADCGAWTTNAYLCTDCTNDVMAARVLGQRAEMAA